MRNLVSPLIPRFRRCLAVIGTLVAAQTALGTHDTLISRGATWRYLDDGSDQGTAWRAAGFDDSAWAQGAAQLGYGDGDETTVVGFVDTDPVTPGTQQNATTYFRTTFQVEDPAHFLSVALTVTYDDGAAVYINGIEVARTSNLAASAAYDTFTTSSSLDNALQTWTLPTSVLQAGTNTIAVEVHQRSADSSDMSFDLKLVGQSMVTRGPYLQMGTPNSVVVRWRTDQATDSRVLYGDSPTNLTSSVTDGLSGTEHEVALTGLAPATRYYYAVGSSTEVFEGGDASTFFVTPPLPGTETPTRIWILGDSGRVDINQLNVRDAYYNFTGTTHTDLWLMLGDNAYQTGTDAEYQTAVFETYEAMLRKSVIWPALGNHDTAQSTNFNGSFPYFSIFTLPTQGEAGGVASNTEHYYSFDHANIHFICLDSQTADRSTSGAMYSWLVNDLAQTIQPWIIAFWHHPPYSKGSHDSDVNTQMREMRENFLPLLESQGVDLVLGGHSHAYERSKLIDGFYATPTLAGSGTFKDSGDGNPAGDGAYGKDFGPNNGAVYAVAGSSWDVTAGSLDHPVMVSSLAEFGSMVLDVNGDQLTARFLNDQGQILDQFEIVKGPPITLADLSQTYDGTPKSASAVTTPPGLTVDFTYDGAPTPPTDAGSYAVVGTINDPDYQGSASGTLVIGKGAAAITLGNLSATYSGAPISATATTNPVGLAVDITYDGSPTPPTNAGTYAVSATINDPNYQGATSGTLIIGKADQTISFPQHADVTADIGDITLSATASSGLPVQFTLLSGPATLNGAVLTITGTGTVSLQADQSGDSNFNPAPSVQQSFDVTAANATVTLSNLSHTYDGSPKAVTAATTPAGLSVSITYDGAPTPPTNAGTYNVTATITDPSFSGSAHASMLIAKAAATVTLGNLAHTFDGTAKSATATTTPGGLGVVLTYDGLATAPTNAGTYTVDATIDDPNFQGSASAVLTVSKADQAITFAPLADVTFGQGDIVLAATASSGLPVSFALGSGAAQLTGNTLSITGTGAITITASQSGNSNYNAATSVMRSFEVQPASGTIVLSGLDHVYDGTPKSVTAATEPAGLPVSLTYNGETTPPSEAGTYAVAADISDPNYIGHAGATLVIAKADQTISFPQLPDVTADIGSVNLSATASSGLPVGFTVVSGPAQLNGSTLSINATGTVTVQATQSGNFNYNAATPVEQSFEVTNANATVTLSNLNHAYDGSPKSVTATTTPENLTVSITYDGSATPPTAAGSYNVVATISDPLYAGSANATLTIAKASATVTLDNLSHVFDGTPKAAVVATTPSGLAVTMTYDGNPEPPLEIGSYEVVATIDDENYSGSATATLVIDRDTQFTNLSSRSVVGLGDDILIPGFAISGSGTKKLLIRGIGPGLAGFGVEGFLISPTLSLYQSGEPDPIASNTGWSNSPNAAEIATLGNAVGAFPLQDGSADCALLVDVVPGSYTLQLKGANDMAGIGLVELYAADGENASARLANISTRSQIGTGDEILIPGYAVEGNTPRTLLIRGVGPGLQQFGLVDVLADPTITVFSTGNAVATNDDWGTNTNASEIASTTTAIGAFALPEGSKDAALLVTLPPGSYTVQLSGVGGTVGVGLVEIYEVAP